MHMVFDWYNHNGRVGRLPNKMQRDMQTIAAEVLSMEESREYKKTLGRDYLIRLLRKWKKLKTICIRNLQMKNILRTNRGQPRKNR